MDERMRDEVNFRLSDEDLKKYGEIYAKQLEKKELLEHEEELFRKIRIDLPESYNELKEKESSLDDEERAQLLKIEEILEKAIKIEVEKMSMERIDENLKSRNSRGKPYGKLFIKVLEQEKEKREKIENKKEEKTTSTSKKKNAIGDLSNNIRNFGANLREFGSCLVWQLDKRVYNFGKKYFFSSPSLLLPVVVAAIGVLVATYAPIIGVAFGAAAASGPIAAWVSVGVVTALVGAVVTGVKAISIKKNSKHISGLKTITKGSYLENVKNAWNKLRNSKKKENKKTKEKTVDKNFVIKDDDIKNANDKEKEAALINEFARVVNNLKDDNINKEELSKCTLLYEQLKANGLIEKVDLVIINKYSEFLNKFSSVDKTEHRVVVRHIEVLLNELKEFKFENTRESLMKAEELLQKINRRESIIESVKNNYNEDYVNVYLKFKDEVDRRKSMYEYIDVINNLKPTKLSFEDFVNIIKTGKERFASIINAGKEKDEKATTDQIFEEIIEKDELNEFKNNYARFMHYSRKFLLEQEANKLDVAKVDNGDSQELDRVDKVVKMAQGYENRRQEEMHRKEKPIIGQKRLEDMISEESLGKLNAAKEIYELNISDFDLICSLVVDEDGKVIVNYNDYRGNKHSVTLTDTVFSGDLNDLVRTAEEEISRKAFLPIGKIKVVSCNADLYLKNKYGSSNKSR